MPMTTRTPGLLLGAAALFVPGVALADSIDPSTFSTTLSVGESTTLSKTVTVDDAPPVDAPVDVFFLADVTGSMGGAIDDVQDSASAIVSAVSGLGDVQFGVGEYRDIFDSAPANPYNLRQDITADTTAVETAINGWFASGGGDRLEGQLPALKEAAETTSWRDDSTRILVWFGDQPGHDPRDGVGEADAIAALQAENIEVQALGVDSFGAPNRLDESGQATDITDATGGEFRDGIATDDVADTIEEAITSAIETYSRVGLDLSAVPTGVTVTSAPAEITGDFDRSVSRTFDFDVTFTGDAAGVYDFPIFATVDGGRVATEDDSITVTDVPEPGTLMLLTGGLASVGLYARRRRRA
jgi:hypothetical protein